MARRKATHAMSAGSAAAGPSPTRTFTIIAQDPSVQVRSRILTAAVSVPNEDLGPGPRGYRVHVVDVDATTNRIYVPLEPAKMGTTMRPLDPYAPRKGERMQARTFNRRLLEDPRFHAQNVYAIVMRTLSHFERALGRRVSWSFGGHQLKVAPHAFAEANAFYSPEHEGLLFGYFAGRDGAVVLNCLSHDIVAHETTHAVVDGLRPRFMEPSSPDQAAFHEGFADIVALLSVFSLREVVEFAVGEAIDSRSTTGMVNLAGLTIEALTRGVLLGLGEQFGEGLSGVHGESLRRSVRLKPSRTLKDTREFQEEHRRGELLVGAVLRAFLAAYRARLTTLGRDGTGRLPSMRVAEEGADIADRLLTMVIRALDYTPPTDIEFGDFLSAIITSDLEIRPDDSRYELRRHLLEGFAAFGFEPVSSYRQTGCWEPPPTGLTYRFVHRNALQRERDEVFRFIWDNRRSLGLCEEAYTAVSGVRPCIRVDQDGFAIRETVADYVQILTVRADEIETLRIPGRKARIRRPEGLADWQPVRLLGGGALVFDEFGHLKYHIRNAVLNPKRQSDRLEHLARAGYFRGDSREARGFAGLHLKGLKPELPAVTPEGQRWL